MFKLLFIHFISNFTLFYDYYLGKEIIEERQVAIRDNYDLLNKLSRERQEILQVK